MNRQKLKNQDTQDANLKIASQPGMLPERRMKIIRYRNVRIKNKRNSRQYSTAVAENN